MTANTTSNPPTINTASVIYIYSTDQVRPLLTIFTPPAWCSERLYTYASEAPSYFGTLSPFARTLLKGGSASSCYPYGHTLAATYSPGVCPSGYNVQTSLSQSDGMMISICCPSGMDYMGSAMGGCGSLVPTSTPVISGSSTITMTVPFMVLDYPVQIAWKSSDLDLFTPASAPLLKAVETTTSHHSGMKPTSNPTSPGLTVKTKAWIAVGTIGGILCFILLVFLLVRVRKHHLQRKERARNEKAFDNPSKPERLCSRSFEIYEASPESNPAEADSSNARVELDAYWHGYEVEGTTVLPSTRGPS